MPLPRSFDLVYFCFFLVHIPASILLDFQIVYPSTYVPPILPALLQWYVDFSADPLIGGIATGKIHPHGELFWLGCFAWLELLFQFPTFLLGLRALWTGSQSIYPLLIAYGASTATTTLPCIFYILKEYSESRITSTQLLILLASYIPFLVVPLVMAIDIGFRVYRIVVVRDGEEEEGKVKRE
ncbi:transmembrane protein 6/97 [Lentinula raphanica]|uniref:Efficient mitochondria targeting-associated protein 19 n=1 Tax=Lentinula raphanica TaxID=153919 RepID=A0AA38PFV7_9AGAR|nr:transmembrane protein 6/97 [Lentinula raphanica]KAJ3842154.1 transmembrane protein 6/97 [Lentinula raphanica]KAJ3964219.1 transmembrane protein 6/97 [Lentinula raphanica]